MDEVRNWLRELGLEQYACKFENDGWDTLEILKHMGPKDIESCIDKPGHRKKFELGLLNTPPTGEAPKVTTVSSETVQSCEKEMFSDWRESYKENKEAGVAVIRQNPTDIPKITNQKDSYQETFKSIKSGETCVSTSEVSDDNIEHNTHPNNILLPLCNATNLPSDSDSELGQNRDYENCYINEEVIETVYVKGAKNKTLKATAKRKLRKQLIGQNHDRSPQSQALPEGILAVKECTQKNVDNPKYLQTDDSSSTSEEENNNVDSTVAIVGPEQLQLFARRPTRPIKKATIVRDSKNVTVAKRAEVYHIYKEEKKKTTDNFKEQIADVVQSYRAKDHLFVETRAFQEVKEIVEDGSWALITGKPGDGKSIMAAHLMLQYYDKGYDPIFLTNAHDWKAMVKGSSTKDNDDKQLAVIDDMFGSMSVDNGKVNDWVSLLDIMQRVVDERKGNLKVICTSRAYVFKDIKSKLEKFSAFQDTKIVDLTLDNYSLTSAEKIRMWNNYIKEYNVQCRLPACVYTNMISPHGFPHCVELFCSNQFLRNEGVSFFENPMKYVCREIQNFKENDKIKYCLLLLLLFKDNRLEMKYVQEVVSSNPPKAVKIFKAAGLSTHDAQSELKKALNSLKNTYIRERLDGTFCFSHESIKENVSFMYIKDSPLHAIEDMDFGYLVDHTRIHGYTSSNDKSIFVLPSFCTNALVERTVKEIQKGRIVPVCQHQAWTDPVFVEKWIAYVSKLFSKDEADVQALKGSIEDIFCTVNACHTLFERTDLNFIDILIYLRHELVLTRLFGNYEIVTMMNTTKLKSVISRALICACFCFPSETIVTMLIKAGADINIVLPAAEVQKYSLKNADYAYAYTNLIQNLSDLYNPVTCSVVTRNKSLTRLFIDNGAKVFIAGEPLALLIAVQLNLTDIIRDLQNIDRVQSITGEGNGEAMLWNYFFKRHIPRLGLTCVISLIHIAKSREMIHLLLQEGVQVNTDVHTPCGRMPHCIFRLLTDSEINVIQKLFSAGLSVTGTWMGRTCVHYLTDYLYSIITNYHKSMGLVLYDSCLTQNLKALSSEIILKFSGINSVNTTDNDNRSPLHDLLSLLRWDNSTFLEIQQEIFRELVAHGADVNLPDNTGMTPTMAALQYCKTADIVLTCVNKRKPNLVDKDGRGYFHYLANSSLDRSVIDEIVHLLLETGEDLNLRDKNGNTPVFECNRCSLACFYTARSNLEHSNKSGENIISYNLHRQESTIGFDIVESLHHLVPKLNVVDLSGRTLMHYLMISQSDSFNRFRTCFQLLVTQGCDSNIPDKNGITPLMLAAENKCFNEVHFAFLLDQDLDILCTDKSNLSALHHCIKSEKDNETKLRIIRMLLNKSRGFFQTGCDILSFVLTQSSCGNVILKELLKHRINNYPDDSKFIIDLLSSSRDLNQKVNTLLACIDSSQLHLTVSDIVESKQIERSVKIKVIEKLLQQNIIKPEETIQKEDDILQIVTGLDDCVALIVFHQIKKSARFAKALLDIQLFKKLCKPDFTECLKYILTVGIHADDQYTIKQDKNGNTVLHVAVRNIENDIRLVEVLNILLEQKPNVYQTNKDGLTPLHIACKTSPLKPQATDLLIENMTDVDQVDCCGMTALQYLCSTGKKGESGSDCQFVERQYLAFCLICKDADVDHQNCRGWTSLMLAIQRQAHCEEFISMLLKSSKNVNIQDANGNSVLHHILRSSTPDDIKASIINALLQKDADVNTKNKNGQTCINIVQRLLVHRQIGMHVFHAFMTHEIISSVDDILEILFRYLAISKNESPAVVRTLEDIIREKNIDVNTMRYSDANTLLMVACESLLSGSVKSLLSLKADPNIKDMIGRTCFTRLLTSVTLTTTSVMHSCYMGDIIRKQAVKYKFGALWTPLIVQQFCETLEDSKFRYFTRDDACYKTISQKIDIALAILQTLLSFGSDPNIPDISEKTALHHFVQSPISDKFICPAIKMLIKHGAEVNARDCEGMTPLMACLMCPSRKSERIRILLAAGANIKETDNFGCDAIEYGKMFFGVLKIIDQ